MGGLNQTQKWLIIIVMSIIVLGFAITRVATAQRRTIIALSSRRRSEEKEKERMSFGAVSGRFGQSRGLLGWILSRKHAPPSKASRALV